MAGLRIPGPRPRRPALPAGEEPKGRRPEKREPKVPTTLSVWFPTHSQMQIRWLSSEAVSSMQGVGRGPEPQTFDQGSPHTCPSQPAQGPQPFCPQEPGAIPSCPCSPGRAPRRPVSTSSLATRYQRFSSSATASPCSISPTAMGHSKVLSAKSGLCEVVITSCLVASHFN